MRAAIVTPPVEPPVSLPLVKNNMRIDHEEDDALIEALMDAAVAHLDGWNGALRRTIMPQTWRVRAMGAGTIILPFPDVSEARFEGVPLDLEETDRGFSVRVDKGGNIDFDCGLSDEDLPTARAIILMLVAHWYAHREAVGETKAKIPLGAEMLISGLRWWGF